MLISQGSPKTYDLGLADSTPQPNVSWGYGPTNSLELIGQHVAYPEIYRRQLWPYVLIKKLGSGTARLPFTIYQRGDGDQNRARPDTDFARILTKPNRRLDAHLLWLWTASTFELYGEAMWLKLRDARGRVQALYPIHPANIQVRRTEGGDIVYLYSAAGSPLAASLAVYPEADVVHFKSYNPDTLLRGMSAAEPLRQSLANEDAARRGSTALWRNGARPSVLLSSPNEELLSQVAIDRLKAQWDAAHGGVDSWGKTAILEQGIVPHTVQLNAEEMQYIDSRRLHREECCAAWDVPPPVVHILDRATFSNITEQMRSMYRDTMTPKLDLYASTIELQLRPDFDSNGELFGQFDLDQVLAGSPEQQIEADAKAIGSAQKTPAEVRAANNRPFIPGSDKLLVNAALIPLDNAIKAPGAGNDVIVHPQAEKSTLGRKDMATLMGRLGRVTSVDEIDPTFLLTDIDDSDGTVQGLVIAAQCRGEDVATLRAAIRGVFYQEDPCPTP